MKKWSVVFLVCFAMFCHAKNSSTNGNLSFVIDFLTKIHSEHKFTIQDEQKFLGMNGGVLNAMGYDGSNLVSSLPGVQPGSDKPVPIYLFE